VDEPASIRCGEEGLARRKGLDRHSLHMSDVNKASEEDDCEWGTVVFNKLSNISLEKIAFANNATAIPKAEYKQ
jgi:hypothetical protein